MNIDTLCGRLRVQLVSVDGVPEGVSSIGIGHKADVCWRLVAKVEHDVVYVIIYGQS